MGHGAQDFDHPIVPNLAHTVALLPAAGLQANRQLPELATIEGVLETAIFKAGQITEANFGDFRKTKWSRSSRTDKGVHSLATVIGLRILMNEDDYLTGE
jgi:tRNA pseudouridine38-40 synthase